MGRDVRLSHHHTARRTNCELTTDGRPAGTLGMPILVPRSCISAAISNSHPHMRISNHHPTSLARTGSSQRCTYCVHGCTVYSGTYVCNFTGTGGTGLVHGVSLCRQCSREGTHHGMEHVVPNAGKRAQRGPRTLAISPNPASEKDKRARGQRNQAESSSPRALPNTLLSLFYFPPPLLHPTIYPHGRTYYPHPCRR